MSEAREQARILARTTFAGFFESELVQPGLPQVRLVVFAAVIFIYPALQLPIRAGVEYWAISFRAPGALDLFMWPHKLLFVTLAMVGTAVVSLVLWDNMFPDRRDAFVIGHLPVRPATVVAARLAAIAAVMGLVALGTALPSALFYGFVAGGYSPGGVLRTVPAHFAATMSASMFAFLLLLALQGALINLVPGRWLQRAMVLLQFVFLVAALEALLFMQPITKALERAMAPGAVQPEWMLWTPPAWFLGLYEVLAGTSRPVGRLAAAAALSIALLLPLAFSLYAITYRRLTRRALESRDGERRGSGRGREPVAAAAAAGLAASPIAGAVARFTVLTLLRNRRHRLLLTLFAGVGTTAAAASVLAPYSRGRLPALAAPEAVLPVGLILVFFLVVGLRVLMTIPAEPPANWPFRLSDAEDARQHLRGASAAFVALGALPAVALLAPLHVFALGVRAALLHSLLLLAAGWMLAEIVLRGVWRIPFTAAFAAPVNRARVMFPIWLIGFSLFAFGLPVLERGPARGIGGGVLLAALVSAVALALRAARERAVALNERLVREQDLTAPPRLLSFDDDDADAAVTLELAGPAVPIASRSR